MDAITSSLAGNASSSDLGTLQGSISVTVLKKALNVQAAGVARLISSLPQPPLATSGSVGTQINAFA